VTHYEAIEYLGDYTLLEVHPRTGRTHQVRVHLSWLGYPLVGDRVYGRQRQELLPDRHFLHASELRFTHPTTGKEMILDTPLPSELEAVLERLR
jgi:23S rRNA pseudouridine1911/1915/1917 synthase